MTAVAAHDRVRVLVVAPPVQGKHLGRILATLAEDLVRVAPGDIAPALGDECALILVAYDSAVEDALALLATIRAQPRHVATPLIVYAPALPEPAKLEALYRAGAVDVVAASTAPAIVRSKVEVFTGLHRRAHPAAEGERGLYRDDEALRMHALVLERMAEGVSVIGADGVIRYANPAEHSMFGYAHGELVGMHVDSLGDPHPTADTATATRVIARLAREESWSGQWRNCRKDGELFVTSVSVTSFEQGGSSYFVCVQEDVTEDDRRVFALQESESHTRAIIDSALDAMITIDEHGLITDWNPQAFAIFGWNHSEALGQSLAGLIIPPEFREAHWRGISRYLATGDGPILGKRLELSAIRRSGELFPVELSIVPSRIGGRLRFCGYLRDITERKRIEDALRDRERLLSLITDILPALVSYIDPDHRYRFANRAYGEWFATTPADVLGQRVTDILGEETFTGLRPRLEAALSGERQTFESRVAYPDGVRDVQIDYMPDIDEKRHVRGIVALVQDVTARKQAEEREHLLVEAMAILNGSLDVDRTLTELSGVAVPRLADWCAIDLVEGEGDGDLRRVVVTHRDPDRVRFAQTVHAAYPTDRTGALHRIASSGRPEFVPEISDAMLVAGANDARHLELLRSLGLRSFLAVPLRARDRSIGVLTLATEGRRHLHPEDAAFAGQLAERAAVAVDNARLYQAEREARSFAADRAEALARTNAELEQFAYVASHDLQEPLRMVLQFLALMRPKIEPHLDDKTRTYLGFVTDGATRMHALIHDLLAYSRLGREDTPPLQEMSLERVLEEALANLRVATAAAGAEVTHDPLPVVRIDKIQLVQVFQNLISNAIKFRAADRPPKITISAVDGPTSWTIRIADNGIGIAPAFHARIFEVFQRLHGRAEYPGTGIGLAIVKKVVERQGGRIWVESDQGQGSTFNFTVPKVTGPVDAT